MLRQGGLDTLASNHIGRIVVLEEASGPHGFKRLKAVGQMIERIYILLINGRPRHLPVVMVVLPCRYGEVQICINGGLADAWIRVSCQVIYALPSVQKTVRTFVATDSRLVVAGAIDQLRPCTPARPPALQPSRHAFLLRLRMTHARHGPDT